MICRKRVFILKEFIYFVLGLILGGTFGWQKNTQLFFFMSIGIFLTVFFYLIIINNDKHIEELKQRGGKR